MNSIPRLKLLKDKDQLDQYQATYFNCSGLSIPGEYLHRSENRVFAIYRQKKMIGGFILGSGQSLRTLEVFAQPAPRQELYEQIGDTREFTEITCFWISPAFRRNTSLNTFVWLSMAFSLRRHGAPNILFGTCSSSLARLYGITPKSELIHQGEMNGKSSFIFQSSRKVSLQGFMEILRFKLRRTVNIRWQRFCRSFLQSSSI